MSVTDSDGYEQGRRDYREGGKPTLDDQPRQPAWRAAYVRGWADGRAEESRLANERIDQAQRELAGELEQAAAQLAQRMAAVQQALLADFMAAGRLANEGRLEDPDAPIPSPWNLADAYRRLYIGMDLNADEILQHAEECAQDADSELVGGGDRGTVLRAVYMHGFSEAAMLFLRRSERP